MANVAIRKESPELVPAVRDWEPFRMMRDFFRWDPFRELMPVAAGERAPTFMPAFEVKETESAILLKADVPGVKEADLEITITGNRLTVSGKRESEKEKKHESYYLVERFYGSFSRSFTLPPGVDAGAMKAELKDGVLTMTVPKKPEVAPQKVTVNADTPKPAAKA